MIPSGDLWAAHFLRNEPDYDGPAWIDAYALAIGRCVPELTPEQAVMRAHLAFEREGDWNNPKIAAGMDALFGPLDLRPTVAQPFDPMSVRGWWWPQFPSQEPGNTDD